MTNDNAASGRPKLRRTATRVNPRDGAEDAWFYENAKSIDVYIRHPDSRTGSVLCRIPRHLLADWIARTEPKP